MHEQISNQELSNLIRAELARMRLRRGTASREDTEDAVMHVFCEWCELEDSELKRDLLQTMKWIRARTSHALIDILRREKNKIDFDAVDEEGIESAMHSVEAIDSRLAFEGMIAKLGNEEPLDKAILTLHYYCGFTLVEVAVALETTVDTVKHRNARACARLKKLIRPPALLTER